MATKTGWTESTDLNWDDVSTEAPPPLAPGIYRAVIVEAKPRQTNKGDPAINVKLAVGDTKRTVYDTLVLSATALFKLKQMGQSAEVSLPANTGIEAIETFCGELTGCEVHVRTKIDTYTPPASEGNPEPAPRVNAKVDRYFTEAQAAEAQSGGLDRNVEAPRKRAGRGGR